MKIALPLTFLLLTCTAGETLFAQAAHSELQPVAFSTLDTNKDGKISPGEARADPGLYEAFAMLDVNHDGYLTPAEFQSWPRASRQRARFAIRPRLPVEAPGRSTCHRNNRPEDRTSLTVSFTFGKSSGKARLAARPIKDYI
jgi:hypothetical protein